MKTIGILGGSSDVATVEYYKIINAGIKARLGHSHTAEVIINSMDFGEVARIVNGNHWEEGEAYVNRHAKALERAGVDFMLCVSHTWHRIDFMKGISPPLLHIVDPTAKAIKASGIKKVLLLGTKPTMSSMWMRDMYATKYTIDVVVPNEEDQQYIDDVIFHELTQYDFKPESKEGYCKIIDKLCQGQDGAKGVILGCTEIGLLVQQSDRPQVQLFEPLRLHAEAAVEMALDETSDLNIQRLNVQEN